MLKLLLLLLSFSFAVALLAGKKQSVGAKGKLLCANQTYTTATVKLIDNGIGITKEHTLADTSSEPGGEFKLSGTDSSLLTITPVLKVYHDCNNEGNPCKRKIKFDIPKHYITDGNYPAK
ncbi:CRE-TTR-44 protein, partial [Aphelenchoides avenae]